MRPAACPAAIAACRRPRTAGNCPLAPGKAECGADAGPGCNFGRTTCGPAGPLRHENGRIVTTYRYENGDLVAEARTGAPP